MTAQVQDIHQQLAMARLPALPQVLLQILELCDRTDVGLNEIGEVAANDASIAARIVSIANSSFYRRERALSNLEQCLSVLGTAVVRRLALNQSVVDLFSRFEKASQYDLRHFWFHGLCVAMTARRLARKLGYGNVEEAYLGGLLHDVGQLALLSVASERYMQMFEHFTGEADLMRQEQQSFGVTHAEIGAWLAQRWNLHGFFVDCILFHHESIDRVRDAHPLVQIVMLANLFNSFAAQDVTVTDQDLAPWAVNLEQASAMVADAEHEARGLAGQLGIEIPPEAADLKPNGTPDPAAQASLAAAVSTRLEAQVAVPEEEDAQEVRDARKDLVRSAALLFQTRTIGLFIPDGDSLHGQDVMGNAPQLEEIRIRFPAVGSDITQAFSGAIRISEDQSAPCNLADAQVARILGSQRLMCLPLLKWGKTHGCPGDRRGCRQGSMVREKALHACRILSRSGTATIPSRSTARADG